MKRILLLDLNAEYRSLKKEINFKINTVLKSQKFILGEELNKFEEEFAKFCKAKYAVGVSSGTAALFVALRAMGIKEGDEVITTPNTFIATTEAITLAGGKIKFIDINEETGLMDTGLLENSITKKTKFIIPVHLFGQITPMKKIRLVANKYKIKILEDAAQAHGAILDGKCPPILQAASYSFFPAKILGGYGDGGCIVTSDKNIYNNAYILRDHGRKKGSKYIHKIEGFNFRLNELQAAILRVKLKYLSQWIEKRQKIASCYNSIFAKYNEKIKPINILGSSQHSFYLYVIRVKQRDGLKNYLKDKGIDTGIHYPVPLHLQPAYRFLNYKKGDFPRSEAFAKEILSLPIHPALSSGDISYIAKNIINFSERKIK